MSDAVAAARIRRTKAEIEEERLIKAQAELLNQKPESELSEDEKILKSSRAYVADLQHALNSHHSAEIKVEIVRMIWGKMGGVLRGGEKLPAITIPEIGPNYGDPV